MNWFSGSIPDAIAESRLRNKIFLVYIEGADDMSKQMAITYNDPAVISKLSSTKVVPLKLTASSQHYVQFSAIFPVLVIPSTFFIGRNGTPIEILTGNIDPPEFLRKIETVFDIFFQSDDSQMTVTKESTVSKSEEPTTSSASSSSSDTSKTNNSSQKEVHTEIAGPSTSETSNPELESQQTLEDRVERAKALIEIRKQEEMRKEQEQLKKDEIERRNMGKAMLEAEKLKKDIELQNLMISRAKDKEEERLAREAVRAQIAQDRAERAARYQQHKQTEQSEREKTTSMQKKQQEENAAKIAAMSSHEARLQFRLPDGSFTTHTFSADLTLGGVRQFVITNVRPPFSNFMLCTTFPRRQFSDNNNAETLRDLQLAPSAVLLILPAQAVASTNSNGDMFTNLFWMLVSPFTSFWRFVCSFFPGSAAAPTPPPPSNENSESALPKERQRQAAHERKEGNFSKKEGNIFRINNQSDDDENNTWNGNSTQQM